MTLTGPTGTTCKRCKRTVPHRAAKLVLAFGMCCLERRPEIVPGFQAAS